MSNIYITEPPTNGKVLLQTSVGDIEIEFWSKESPKAVRNFVQLCMEGYYNKTVFHRLVPDFIVQGGDPTGTGEGGESIYGKPFRTEVHSRLRFNRRGLVAMSSTGPDDNRSQFFFTLGATPELDRKHTIFGKVIGNTLYNMINLGNGEVDQNERPVHLHRIFKTEVISNPFPDIVPRAIKTDDDSNADKKKQKSTARATKNFSLLSFGEEAEEEEEELTTARTETSKSKGKSSHDLLDDPRLSKQTVAVDPSSGKRRSELEEEIVQRKRKLAAEKEELEKYRSKMFKSEPEEVAEQKKTVKEEIIELQRELARERRNAKADKESGEKVDAPEEDAEQNNAVDDKTLDPVAAFKAERQKFIKGGGGKKKKKKSLHEKATMELFSNFLKKLQSREEEEEEREENSDEDASASKGKSYLTHRMVCEEALPVMAMDASSAKDHERYDLYDPRNSLNKRRREKK